MSEREVVDASPLRLRACNQGGGHMPTIQPNVSIPATQIPPGERAPRRASTHRIYRHAEGPYIPCRTVSHEELVALAEGADRVEFHEAAPPTRLRMADTAILLEALRGLPWVVSRSEE